MPFHLHFLENLSIFLWRKESPRQKRGGPVEVISGPASSHSLHGPKRRNGSEQHQRPHPGTLQSWQSLAWESSISFLKCQGTSHKAGTSLWKKSRNAGGSQRTSSNSEVRRLEELWEEEEKEMSPERTSRDRPHQKALNRAWRQQEGLQGYDSGIPEESRKGAPTSPPSSSWRAGLLSPGSGTQARTSGTQRTGEESTWTPS